MQKQFFVNNDFLGEGHCFQVSFASAVTTTFIVKTDFHSLEFPKGTKLYTVRCFLREKFYSNSNDIYMTYVKFVPIL